MADQINGLSYDVDMEIRHRKERKELQAKVTNLKRSIAKGDKKRKREIAEEIAKLEAELEQRHDLELDSTGDHSPPPADQNATDSNEQILEMESKLKAVDVNDCGADDASTTRISKAQKRRNKKEQKDKERDELIRDQEEMNLSGVRHVETEKLKAVLELKDLKIYEIPSDGDCLYRAVGHQLSQHGITMNVSELRQKTAEFIRQNKEEFAPFLCDHETGSSFTNEMFDAYCEAINTTSVWGGQLELRAISQVLKRPVEILQAEGQHVIIGNEFTGEPLVVTYHRHAYKLGEHFNSVCKASEAPPSDGFS